MISPERRTEFQEVLWRELYEINAEVIGWVVLSNHYHIRATADSLNLVSNIIQLIHGRTSRDWNLQDGLTGKRRVWYRFSDRMMRNQNQLYQTLNYIHFNPVKHGYVKDAYDWPWSSLYMYEDEKGRVVERNWKKYKPPADFGKSWDM
jgi:putative transposase